jgi:ribonuclease D
MEILYIDTAVKLHELCQQLHGSKWLALDTEFMREKTYYPQLCLLQIGTPEITACVDPLALGDLGPLLDLLYDPGITKVMHAGGQDMEIFFHLRGELPKPVFDTQIAAPLLGFPEQAAYARLVEDILGVHLQKTHTRADWSHRPLSPAQLEYAADDVIYLCRLYVHLRDKLTQRGRLDWLNEDFDSLCDAGRYNNPPALAWQRVKAARKLRGAQLAILQGLAEWREQLAQQEDMPRGWLIKDDVLADIARQQPKNLAELGRIRGLNERTVKRRGDNILTIIRQGSDRQPQALPDYVKSAKPTVEQEAIVDLLNAVVHLRAAQQQLNPAQLASHKELQRLVLGEHDLHILNGWRRQLIGEELQAVLAGDRHLGIKDGKLTISTNA